MSGKIIEISTNSGHLDGILSIAEQHDAEVISILEFQKQQNRVAVRIYSSENSVQTVLDSIQTLLPDEADSTLLLLPVDARVGDSAELVTEKVEQVAATREELFTEINKGTDCDLNFVLLAILSTLVAAIGLAENNVAVVIGAMVIAPLLGPNLGLALGAALGDKELIKKALFTNFIGVTLTIGLAMILVIFWQPDMHSQELLSRTEVQLSSVVIALAAGIAAVQSLTTRLANLLVGVMVAVALVPPATVLGMMIGLQEWSYASGAALLLLVNIAAVNLSAQIVFLLRGIRPRTWIERREAQQATWINITIWMILLGLCVLLIVYIAK
ncbi:MAG: TIGR00341 family protein [Gammaproteobacteria bacterium]|nr:TIGR00341 family protein [Gammaproteobacteria bacterium]